MCLLQTPLSVTDILMPTGVCVRFDLQSQQTVVCIVFVHCFVWHCLKGRSTKIAVVFNEFYTATQYADI